MRPLGEIAKELVRLRIEAERGATLEASDSARTGATGAADRMASTTKSLREGKPSMALAYGWEGQPMGNSGKAPSPKARPVHRVDDNNDRGGVLRGPFPRLVAVTVGPMPTRKTAGRKNSAVFLMCIEGGKR